MSKFYKNDIEFKTPHSQKTHKTTKDKKVLSQNKRQKTQTLINPYQKNNDHKRITRKI